MKKFKSLSSSLFPRPHFLSFCLFLAFCFLIFSCNVFSPSIRHYLSEYSQNIIVKDFIPAGDYQIDKNGNLCIPSEGNNYFTLFYANPADHSFGLQYFDNSTPWTDMILEGGVPYSYDSLTFSVDNKADLNYLNLFFEESGLKEKEKNGNTKVSLNFKLVDRINGETIEKTLSFVINTPPYIFQGEPVFGSLGTQSVLCLNFAKYSDNPIIWNDFCTQENGKTVFVIKINNEDYKFELNKSKDTISYIGSNNSGTLLTENLNSIVFNTGIFTQNSNSIYFAFSSDISSFTVIAEDSAGLKVEYKINSSSFEKILYVANVPKSSNHSGSIKDPANLQNALDFLKGKNGEWTIRIMEDLIQNSSDSHFASIDLSTNSDYPSTITIEGYNGIKIIDGNKKSSIFKFVGVSSIPDFTVILKNLIMQKGQQKENTGPGGGGIYCIRMNLKMYNCEVKKNLTPDKGGGLYLSNSSLELNNCKINNNTSTAEGGGIFSLNSSLIISNTEINNNASSFGGGIYYDISDNNTYISRLTNCTISKNTASDGWSYGGGLYLIDRKHSLNNKFYCTNCSINNNSSKNRGAGFYVDSIKLILSTCSIKNNSVNGELSIAGAGIYCTSLNCLQYTSDTQIKNNNPDNVYVKN